MDELNVLRTQTKLTRISKKYLKAIQTLAKKSLSKREPDIITLLALIRSLEVVLRLYELEVIEYGRDAIFTYEYLTDITSEQALSNELLQSNYSRFVNNKSNEYLSKVTKSLYYTSDTTNDIIYSEIVDRFYHEKGGTVRGLSGQLLRGTNDFTTKAFTLGTQQDFTNLKSKGYEVEKRWVYTYESATPRQHHMAHNGVIADESGYFQIGKRKTLGPGLFGVPDEDMNCKCRIGLVVDEPKTDS